MATPDVPIAKWVGHPKSFTSGRKSGQPSVIVIHTTDGHEGASDAENGAAYDKRRTDGTSTHYFVDSNSVVQEVEHKDESHAARAKGNDIGIQIEICGLAGQTAAQWSDAVSKATLEKVAQLIVQIRKTGNYPLTRLTGAKLKSAWNGGKTRGICGHIDITNAFPEDNGTHTDPGKSFPWAALFVRIKEIENPKVEAEVSKQEVLDGLAQYFGDATAAPTAQGTDGMKTTMVGEQAWFQPVPNVFRKATDGTIPRTSAWVLLTDMATHIAAGSDPIDEVTLANAMAPMVVAGVLAGMPDNGDPISQEEVTTAVLSAFQRSFGSAPSA